MRDRSVDAVPGRDGRTRALRLHLEEDPGDGPVRTEAAVPGVRVDFDARGRALALEIDTRSSPQPDRVDRVLEALGRPGLDPGERRALLVAGRAARGDREA